MKDWRFLTIRKRYKLRRPQLEWKTNRKSYAIYLFNDTEQSLTHILMLRDYDTLNISVTVYDRHIFKPIMDN